MKVIGAVKNDDRNEFSSYMVELYRSELVNLMETLCVNSTHATKALANGCGPLMDSWNLNTKCRELHRTDSKLAGVLAKLAEAKASLIDVEECVTTAKGVRAKEQEKK